MHRLHLRPVLSAAAMLVVLAGCSTKPDAPSFDNPFDPDGTGGDPYELRAEVVAGEVRLAWIDEDAVVTWTVYHSTTSANDLSALGEVTVERLDGTATAVHADYSPARTNWYRVQGQLGSGELLPLSLGAAAQVSPPPLVRTTNGTPGTTGTRSLELEVRTDVGDAVELSNFADFSEVESVSTTPGEAVSVPWTLPATDQDGSTFSVHFRNRVGSSVGIVDSLQLTVRFAPTLAFTSGTRLGETSLSVVDTAVTLAATGQGVVRARLAFDEAELSAAVWDETPDALDWIIPLSVTEADTLFGEVESDFGFSETVTLPYTPATEVADASLRVVDDAETTVEASVELVSEADGAGEMILSEAPDFGDASWSAFADTVLFDLSAGAGEKTIFGRYRNAWDSEGSSAVTRVFRLGGE